MLSEKLVLVLGCLLHAHSAVAIWSCTLDSDCQSMTDSICQGGVCVCPFGKQSVLGGTMCADVAPYHFSPCMDDFQCSRLFTSFQCRRPVNSTMEDFGNCLCSPGNHYFRGRCWPTQTLGETCTRTEECRGGLNDPFAMTCSEGVCECSTGYFMRQRGECRRIAGAIGDQCVLDQDCQFPGGFCEPTTASPFTLRCVFRDVPESETEPPVDPVEPPVDPVDPTDPPVDPVDPTDPPVDPVDPTDPPVDPVDPTDPPVDPVDPTDPPVPTQAPITMPPVVWPNAAHPEQLPVNPANTFSANIAMEPLKFELGKELPVSDILVDLPVEKLVTNIDQAVNSSSRSLTYGAACSTETEPCAAPFECSSLGMCHCPLGYYPNAAGTICLAELGSPVTPENPCTGIFTEVRDGVCSCWPNFYFNEDMRTCVKATRRLSDSCVIDANCHSFGVHARCGAPKEFGLRSCECNLNETVWDSTRNMCRLFAGIGEICDVDSDCIAGELEIQCVPDDAGERRCACPPGYVASDGLCLTLGLNLGDTCQVSMECEDTDNAICADNVCSCRPGYQQNGDICAPMLGGSCDVDSDCVIEDTVCSPSTNTCTCDYGFVEYQDLCYPAVAGYEAPCYVSAQCVILGDGGVCVGGNCTCDDRYHYRDGGCWERTALFSTCRRSSECYLGDRTDLVQCRNSLCQCNFNNPYSEELGTCRSSAVTTVASSFIITTALFYLLSR